MTDTICPECEDERQIYTIRKRMTLTVRGVDITVYGIRHVCSRGHEFEDYDDGQARFIALYLVYENLTGKNIEGCTYDQYVVYSK